VALEPHFHLNDASLEPVEAAALDLDERVRHLEAERRSRTIAFIAGALSAFVGTLAALALLDWIAG